ncbi:g2998 [Coccomyxa viridis]|uniref:G2998 protein n=1 Tax=Coccomyxa viridis TaxID=1274662 RepID=A0ABP1FRX8_9CHLO
MTASRLLAPSTGISANRRASRPARAVRVFASSQERQGPKDIVLKTLSAIAAAQLAVLPFSGPAIALPDLKAQAEESDRKTDNLPTFKDIGSSLNNKFGQTDPKDVGKAVEQNTPDVDLTKNPKDLVKDAGNAINKATPDLSEAPGPYDTAREQRDEANSYGSGDSGSQAGIPKALQGNPGQQAVGKAANVGSNPAQKPANPARDDVSDLPNPFSGNPANEAATKAQRAAEDVGKKLPGAGDVTSAAKNAIPALPKIQGDSGLPGSGTGKGDLFKSRNL